VTKGNGTVRPPKRHLTLEIENPAMVCGHCRFATELSGEWSVEDGMLVFRADPDPQPGRGPDLDGCFESDVVIEFEHIEAGRRELLPPGQAASLRKRYAWARVMLEDPFKDLIERSSLGTPAGRALRRRTPPGAAREVLRRDSGPGAR